MDISEILRRVNEFGRRFDAARSRARSAAFGWYPYDSLANFTHLDRLLTGEHRRLLHLAGQEPVADVGCADGAVAFFLETLGCRVHAIDHPASNYNGMRGVRALKEVLDSSVEIHAADLDREFTLPAARYGLAFFLGTLYHLKNPFLILETLARNVQYCILSTRVAGFTPGRHTDLRREPLAYLLEEGEANADATNFWIFSDTALRRLLTRSGWRVLDYMTIGAGQDAEPASALADGRAFCLVESRYVDLENNVELLEGWHEVEYRAWRWTTRRFSARLAAPPAAATLEFRFHLPDPVIEKLGQVTLTASVNGAPLAGETYRSGGDHRYSRPVPAEALAGGQALVVFELDRALEPSEADQRELGVLVCFTKSEVEDGRLNDQPLALF